MRPETGSVVHHLASPLIARAGRIPVLRDLLIAGLEAWSAGTPFGRRHPFHRRHGVQTSGAVPGIALMPRRGLAYVAAQPSIIRTALPALPDRAEVRFIDFGGGKGRPLLIAGGLGFRAVMGLEFSPTLARIARRNAAILARAPGPRVPISIVEHDATTFSLPTGTLALFFYNPFADTAMAQVIGTIERSLAAALRGLFVIAYNPVAAPLFDTSPALERFFAAQLPYAAEELGFGPDRDDAVVIWCNRGNTRARPAGNPMAEVTVLSSMRAVIAPDETPAFTPAQTPPRAVSAGPAGGAP